MAEIELSALGRSCLARRIAQRETLVKEIDNWVTDRNQTQASVNWQFKMADARIKLKKLYPSLQ